MIMRSLLTSMLLMPAVAFAQVPPPLGSSGGLLGNPAAGGANPQGAFLEQTEADIAAQASGQFPSINRSATGPIGAIQESWNDPQASNGQQAPGVVRYSWRPDFVMPIRTREFMTTTIELPKWENIDRFLLGDGEIFEASRVKNNILVIRPSHAGADSNLTAIGVSGNIYNFYIRSESWNSKEITDLTVYVNAPKLEPLSEKYKKKSSKNSILSSVSNATTSKNSPPDYIRELSFNPENLRFDMKIYAQSRDDMEIAPVRVFHDGIWTYFDFGHKADTVRRPVVFQVIDGVDTMVNTRTAGPTGNILIAEAVGNFTMRNGNRVVCVFQKGHKPQHSTPAPTANSMAPQHSQTGGLKPHNSGLSFFNNSPPTLNVAEPAMPSQVQGGGGYIRNQQPLIRSGRPVITAPAGAYQQGTF